MMIKIHLCKINKTVCCAFSALTFLVLSTSAAFAEAQTGGGGAHRDASTYHKEVSGLPQLDFSTYASQGFWLAISFAILYIFFARKTLPEISSLLENRQEHIQNDLNAAENLRKEAECVQQAYDNILEEARNKASNFISEAEENIKDSAHNEAITYRERVLEKSKAAEKTMEKAKADAMGDMNAIAAEIAREAAQKIIGIETDINQAKTVVESIHESKAKAA